MLDQDTVTARVLRWLEAENRKLSDLSPEDLDMYVELAFIELVEETGTYPR